jgi:hypothetical protein
MRAFWRGDKPLRSHAEWRGKLGKNSKQGTSAPTLAAVWGGPVELMGALRHQPEFEGLRLTHVVVEAQSSVDEFSGPRNHDLVARGELPSGESVVICVEAKAGESFGATVKQQTSAAARAKSIAKKDGKTSNAPERLKGLLERFVDYPTSEPRVQNMRYQLLTALAGTLSEAEERGAQHAVLMVHEFLTDERPNAEIVREHDRDLHNFVTTVFGLEPPSAQQAPWCVDVSGMPWSSNRKLYLARAISDLRTSTLESVSRVERDSERGRATAAKLKALGAKGILIRAAEQGYITQLACKMPECFCPEELGGACHFDPVNDELSDWMPTLEHFPISKREGGKKGVENAILAHRVCNRIDYSITDGRSYASDVKRIRKAREDAIRRNKEGPDASTRS